MLSNYNGKNHQFCEQKTAYITLQRQQNYSNMQVYSNAEIN